VCYVNTFGDPQVPRKVGEMSFAWALLFFTVIIVLMIITEVLTWWYTTGWMHLVHRAGGRIQNVLDFFSVNLLVGTLFDPFRQIDAGKVRGSLQEELRAFGNRTFSRIVGFFIRTVTIVAGIICTVVITIVGLLQLLLWPLLPLMPLIGLLIALTGSTP